MPHQQSSKPNAQNKTGTRCPAMAEAVTANVQTFTPYRMMVVVMMMMMTTTTMTTTKMMTMILVVLTMMVVMTTTTTASTSDVYWGQTLTVRGPRDCGY